MTIIAAMALGVVALLPVWAVGRWVTRYDHPDDHRDVGWNLLAGTIVCGASAVLLVIIYGIGRLVLHLFFGVK